MIIQLLTFYTTAKGVNLKMRRLKLTAIPSQNLPVGSHNKTVKRRQTTNR
jgi:hypothetical protein